MKHETKLTKKEEGIVNALVKSGRFGDSCQDKYLDVLCTLIGREKSGSYGMLSPFIVCDSEDTGYRFQENYRRITDVGRPAGESFTDSMEIFAYFDHPVSSSALYFGIFDKRLKYSVMDVIQMIGARCYATSSSTMPMTFKVDMTSFVKLISSDEKKIDASRFTLSSMNTLALESGKLKYLNDRILGPEELFDVIEVKPRR